MYELLRYDQPRDGLKVPYLVLNLLDPLVDAGDVMQTIDSTISSLDGVELASFDSDPLYDYRAQRPVVDYEDGSIVDFTLPQMRLMLYTDVTGKNFLYLCGHEPDFRWSAVAREVLNIIDKFGVEHVISYAAMPATVPHTRPADMLIRSTRPIDSVSHVKASITHYGSLSDYVEYLVRDNEKTAVANLRVRVPFYMARGPFPFVSGALAALKMTASLGGPTLPLGDLEQIEDRQLAQGV
ncbi:MAG: PAC2 family protein [Arcanobacterium sp.]|nr:PAC2 family protein [Arcanobacterium sp.]